MMQIIALTSANEAATAAATSQLLNAAAERKLSLTVMQGVNIASEATAVYCGGGELWRIGHDDTRPELDSLIDRHIDDSSHQVLTRSVDQALGEFLGKTRIAA